MDDYIHYEVTILNTEMLDMLLAIQKVKFNENIQKLVSKFLLESRKLHVLDEKGIKWGN